MAFWNRKGSKPKSEAAPQHCVKLHITLSDNSFGAAQERAMIHGFSDRLSETIAAHSAGEYDGDEFGAGECVLFMYGPDADRLYATIAPIIESWPAVKVHHAILRYGEPGAPSKTIEFDASSARP